MTGRGRPRPLVAIAVGQLVGHAAVRAYRLTEDVRRLAAAADVSRETAAADA